MIETSKSEAVRQHAENDRGVDADGRLANRTEKQASSSEAIERGRVSGEADWVGKTSTATPQNGENEPHYHPKGASTICGWHNRAGWLRICAKEKLKAEIPA
jgi:hypothetical protein